MVIEYSVMNFKVIHYKGKYKVAKRGNYWRVITPKLFSSLREANDYIEKLGGNKQ